MQDVDPNLDFYTPVIIASEDTLKNNPELVKKFLKATAMGYQDSISKPEEAAADSSEVCSGNRQGFSNCKPEVSCITIYSRCKEMGRNEA